MRNLRVHTYIRGGAHDSLSLQEKLLAFIDVGRGGVTFFNGVAADNIFMLN